MKRIIPLLALCLLMAGCSVHGPGHDGAVFWAFDSNDGVLDYIWKPLANVVVGTVYAVVVATAVVVEACANCGGCTFGIH